MSLIRRKPEKKPHDHGLRAVALLARGLMAQRVARKAYTGYKWTRRIPFLLGGAAIAAVVAGLLKRKSDAGGTTPSTPAPSTTSTAASSPSAPTPSTPTPTGSPTAVTPAPTAAEDGAPSS